MTDDKELIARLRELDGWVMLGAHTHLAAADRIEALTAKLAKAVETLASLEKAASDVARRGAQIGPQWTKLTVALLVARATLAAVSETHKITSGC